MAIGMNADTDWANRTTDLGGVGIANLTLAGWHYVTSGTVTDYDAICGVSHASNGRFIALMRDNAFPSPHLSISDHVSETDFPSDPPVNTWVFFIIRSGAAGGTITGEWSSLGSSTWITATHTNGVEGSVQGNQVLLGRSLVGEAQTSKGNYAYWHAYDSEIGETASRALKDKTTPQNSPWAFWPLDDNTDTGDDSGNGRTITFNGSMTSETSPVVVTSSIKDGIGMGYILFAR